MGPKLARGGLRVEESSRGEAAGGAGGGGGGGHGSDQPADRSNYSSCSGNSRLLLL